MSDVTKWQFLCAADMQPIQEGQHGIVVVTTRDPENPVSVYVHNTKWCRSNARNYPSNIMEIMDGWVRQHPEMERI